MVQHPVVSLLKLKTTIKMAISKLQFIQEKKTAMTKQQRRLLADLLNQGKESSAKIRVENIIRDDIYIELLEYLELYCELLLARISLIADKSVCDESLLESVESIIYSAPHTELKELAQLRELLILKFGVEFGKQVKEKAENVPDKIIKRCNVAPPSDELVNLYLCEIARTYGAVYSGLAEELVVDDAIEGDEKVQETAGGEKEAMEAVEGKQDELDALKARFAALKR